MAGNENLEPLDERGWRRGLRNLLGAGFAGWWKSNQWWIQTLIWVSIINLILAAVLWGAEEFDPVEGVALYTIFNGLFPPIALIIIMQDAVVGEKLSGTAAWVLSKPVSRTAFILSKLIPSSVGALTTMALFPSLVAFIQLSLAGVSLSPLRFLAGVGVLGLNLLFYLTLTVMLGVLSNQRAVVIAVPLAFAFGQQYLIGMLPALKEFLPWSLMLPPGEGLGGAVAPSIMTGVEPFSWNPLYFAIFCVVLFSVVAVWRFQDEEF